MCTSFTIPANEFDPKAQDLPIHRVMNSWWECGCEYRNTYTQAFCRSAQIGEDEQARLNRVRYSKDTNVNLWSVRQTESNLEWTNIRQYQVLAAIETQTLLLAATGVALMM